jgi:hypothetical protein
MTFVEKLQKVNWVRVSSYALSGASITTLVIIWFFGLSQVIQGNENYLTIWLKLTISFALSGLILGMALYFCS